MGPLNSTDVGCALLVASEVEDIIRKKVSNIAYLLKNLKNMVPIIKFTHFSCMGVFTICFAVDCQGLE